MSLWIKMCPETLISPVNSTITGDLRLLFVWINLWYDSVKKYHQINTVEQVELRDLCILL